MSDPCALWSDWAAPHLPGATPYQNWWLASGRAAATMGAAPLAFANLGEGQRLGPPMPRASLNPAPPAGAWLPAPEDLPEVPDDTVIVGVIDTGIAFGQHRFRLVDGNTRLLGAWQQAATFAGPSGLPFGRVLPHAEIDGLLGAHTHAARFDEPAFNRAAGITDMATPLGDRTAALRHAHGSFVADLAGGMDPADLLAARMRLLVVTLPHVHIFGHAGTFLDQFMALAVRWIKEMSEAIWTRNNPDATADARRGYPLAINLSFGRQAGSKDLHDWFPQQLEQLAQGYPVERDASDTGPLHAPHVVVMPTGNDNRDRCRMALNLGLQDSGAAKWRLRPEDPSANYLELWTTVAGDAPAPGEPVDLAISVTPPGVPEPAQIKGRVGQVRSLPTTGHHAPQAQLYCEVHQRPGADFHRVRYVLCAGPTRDQPMRLATTVSGVWTVSLWNGYNHPLDVEITVQTDQAILTGAGSGQRARLEDPAHRLWDAAGRPTDLVAYRDRNGIPLSADGGTGSAVTFAGTMNASAATDTTIAIGGYRASDGCPARYSSSALGASPQVGRRADPFAAMPSEDSAALFGILAAGGQDGAVVAMRGTSFAAPQATRTLALGWLAGSTATLPGFGAEPPAPQFSDRADARKVGVGRFPAPAPRPIDRMTRTRKEVPLTS